MSGFEFIFSLFGLLLGLALAEALGGLARALKASHKVRIGWPTTLLGVLVSCDVVTFWMYGWSFRERLVVSWPLLFGGFVVTAIYYVAASLIFPDDPEEWSDLNGHFDKHYRKVLGAIFFCNAALVGLLVVLVGPSPLMTMRGTVLLLSLFPVSLIAIVSKDRRVAMACMVWLILLYPLSALWT
ncbi:hypothetical protein [Sphingomonas sp.]|uniref:hypothetical protein n=1 Tax=Sphingomonas sp. TaxID=28214 RepID=UPI001D8AAFDC|nr:hypothetical protein [Sphingomonas sp.]MBX9796632.1 hypothetical protein [Sphingomonas sp.]